MSRTAVKIDSLQVAARKLVNASARQDAVLGAQADSSDPDAQHHWLAINRSTRSKIAARSALLRAVPSLPSAIDLGDVLVVVAPGEQADQPRPGRRWDPEQLQVIILPRSAVI